MQRMACPQRHTNRMCAGRELADRFRAGGKRIAPNAEMVFEPKMDAGLVPDFHRLVQIAEDFCSLPDDRVLRLP